MCTRSDAARVKTIVWRGGLRGGEKARKDGIVAWKLSFAVFQVLSCIIWMWRGMGIAHNTTASFTVWNDQVEVEIVSIVVRAFTNRSLHFVKFCLFSWISRHSICCLQITCFFYRILCDTVVSPVLQVIWTKQFTINYGLFQVHYQVMC